MLSVLPFTLCSLVTKDNVSSPEEVHGPTNEEREKSTPTPDKDKNIKETPPPTVAKKPKPRKPETPPLSPRASLSMKETKEKKSGLSKLFGRSSVKKDESEGVKPSERVLSGDWEILENPTTVKSSPDVAKKRPPVASKPKPSASHTSAGGEEQKPSGDQTSPRKMPGMVATAPMSELANVLKGSPLKPANKV